MQGLPATMLSASQEVFARTTRSAAANPPPGAAATDVSEANGALRYAAGNFYVNDKPTGSVVGQQPGRTDLQLALWLAAYRRADA